MITHDELDRMLVDLESDRIEKTISETDTNKFGQAICAFANDFSNHQKYSQSKFDILFEV